MGRPLLLHLENLKWHDLCQVTIPQKPLLIPAQKCCGPKAISSRQLEKSYSVQSPEASAAIVERGLTQQIKKCRVCGQVLGRVLLWGEVD